MIFMNDLLYYSQEKLHAGHSYGLRSQNANNES